MRDSLIFIVIWLGSTISVFLIIWIFNKLHSMDWEFKHFVVFNSQAKGKINLFEFSVKSGVHPAIARWYLNRKAKQFNAFTDCDELGEILYYFGEAKRDFLAQIEAGE